MLAIQCFITGENFPPYAKHFELLDNFAARSYITYTMTPISSSPTQSKHTILVIDDEPGPRDALKVILKPFFNVETVDCAQRALQVLSERHVDLITLDQKLPDRQGLDLLQDIKRLHHDIEVVIITGYGSLKSAMDGIRHGAAGYLLKPFNVTELISLINQALDKKKKLDFFRDFLTNGSAQWSSEADALKTWETLRERYRTLSAPKATMSQDQPDYSEVIPLLSTLLEAKHRALLNHSSRVSFYATLLGNRLTLTAPEQKALAIGAFLHDIGMIGIDTDPTAAQEIGPSCTEHLHQHTEMGARMVLPLGIPADVVQVISYHHERVDGTGYPNGLKGEGIPLLARIVAIAEAFDQQMTDHEGRMTWSVEETLIAMREQVGTAYDARLFEIFQEVILECKTSLPALAMSNAPIAASDL